MTSHFDYSKMNVVESNTNYFVSRKHSVLNCLLPSQIIAAGHFGLAKTIEYFGWRLFFCNFYGTIILGDRKLSDLPTTQTSSVKTLKTTCRNVIATKFSGWNASNWLGLFAQIATSTVFVDSYGGFLEVLVSCSFDQCKSRLYSVWINFNIFRHLFTENRSFWFGYLLGSRTSAWFYEITWNLVGAWKFETPTVWLCCPQHVERILY